MGKYTGINNRGARSVKDLYHLFKTSSCRIARMSCIHFDNDSPGNDSDPLPTDVDSGTSTDVESSVGNLTASTDAENFKGGDTTTDAGTDRSLILGEEENGSSEEILSQKDISAVINAEKEKKLAAYNEWWHTAMLIFADVVGSGVLALPGAFARIGWFFGILLLIVCYLMYVVRL